MPRKKELQEISFFIPEGYRFSIEGIVKENHSSRRNDFNIWELKYFTIIDYIVAGHLKFKSDAFVNINQTFMKRILGCDSICMSALLKKLVNEKLIVCDDKVSVSKSHFKEGKRIYTTEGKSYGFKIPDYQNKKIEEVKLHTSVATFTRLRNNKEKAVSQNEELQLYQKCLKSVTIDSSRLPEIFQEVIRNKECKVNNVVEYSKFIKECVNNNTIIPFTDIIVPDQNSALTPLESDDKTIARIMRAVGIINSGQMIATRPVENSRVYCELTNLNREIRRAVLIDGKEIIGLDIRNSQPLLASYLFKKHFKDLGRNVPLDVIQYQHDCERGVFYDDFMKEIRLPNHFRTEFKKDFFRQVFFSMLTDKTNRLKEMFITKYPNCWEVIIDEKGGRNFSREYNKFAQRLQEVEAMIIFDTVNIGLLKQGIKCYNNFDSIYVNSMESYEIAKDFIIAAFNSIGINPTINAERYD